MERSLGRQVKSGPVRFISGQVWTRLSSGIQFWIKTFDSVRTIFFTALLIRFIYECKCDHSNPGAHKQGLASIHFQVTFGAVLLGSIPLQFEQCTERHKKNQEIYLERNFYVIIIMYYFGCSLLNFLRLSKLLTKVSLTVCVFRWHRFLNCNLTQNHR